jgi:5-methylcytosine-specific restriction endonuclease McrA
LQHSFDNSETEQEASEKITTLAQWTDLDKNTVTLNEYYRLTNTLPIKGRQFINKHPSRARESVPSNLRTLLEHLYKGKCQLCNFGFLKRDKKPYFEIHHLDPLKGHHPKNLLVVCGNCHNQSEYADVKQEFNEDEWLFRVSFNEITYPVKQVMLGMRAEVFSKQLFI